METRSEYITFELAGNKKTKSGDQIEEWISPQAELMQAKMALWDWTKPFEFKLPDKALVTEFDELLKDNGLPDKLPELGKLVLYTSSKLTDFIKGSFLEQYGLIVSERAKTVLEQYNIGKHKFYPITLNHKNVDKADYYFFKSLTNANEYIDIKNSSFYSQKGYFNTETKKPIAFKNLDEINEFRQNNAGNNIHIFADKIRLTKSFPKYDYFMISEFGIYNKFLSQNLADRLKALTGINLIEADKFIS